VLAGAATVGLALASASAVGEGSKMAVVLPLAAGVGLLMGLMATSRFSAYLLLTLGVRSSLDLAKLSGSDGGPRALDPAVLVGVLFLGAGLLWLAGQYRARGSLPGSPLRTAMLVFLLACSLSVLGSGDLGSSLLEAVRIASVVMMFIVVEQVCADERRMQHVLLAVFASALVPLAVTAFGFLSGHGRVEEKGEFTRVTGTFNQSNEFGRYLMLVIIMGVALYPALPARVRRPMAVLLLACGASLIPTYTRSALLATFVGLVVVGLVHNKKMVFALLATGALVVLAVPSLSARFGDLGGSESQDTGVPESSLTWRLNYWQQVLPLARQNPVTGIGLAQTQRLTDNQQPPHNDYVRAYVETGLVGFSAYLLLLWMLVSTGRHALAAAPRASLDRAVAAGFYGCAVAFVAVSIVANVFSNVVTLWYFATFAGAAAAVLRRRTAPAITPLETSWR
ncbi:MAG TPA: O-antigen ligase family protein, partial [Acidimicrobiia bacterium]